MIYLPVTRKERANDPLRLMHQVPNSLEEHNRRIDRLIWRGAGTGSPEVRMQLKLLRWRTSFGGCGDLVGRRDCQLI